MKSNSVTNSSKASWLCNGNQDVQRPLEPKSLISRVAKSINEFVLEKHSMQNPITPTSVPNEGVHKGLSSTQIMRTLEPKLASLTEVPYRVADLPNPRFNETGASRYVFRDSMKFTDKPNQAALTKVCMEGVSPKKALAAPNYWKYTTENMRATKLHSIKCLNAAALVGETIKEVARQNNLHVYQAGAPAYDHHLVLVTPEPIDTSDSKNIQTDRLPAGTVVVDLWAHYIHMDESIHVEDSVGIFGQEKLSYDTNNLPKSVEQFQNTGLLSDASSCPYTRPNEHQAGRANTIRIFTEIT